MPVQESSFFLVLRQVICWLIGRKPFVVFFQIPKWLLRHIVKMNPLFERILRRLLRNMERIFRLKCILSSDLERLVINHLQELSNWRERQGQNFTCFMCLPLRSLNFLILTYLLRRSKLLLRYVYTTFGLAMRITPTRVH